MLKIKAAVFSVLAVMVVLCFVACTQQQTSTNQVLPNSESASIYNQEDTQQSDVKIFFGEEYIKRNDIKYPKHVNKNIPMGLVKKQEYKLVTPTRDELDEIVIRLDPILSMFSHDYDSEKDNIYEFLFSYDHLDYVYPEYDDEVSKFIAKPFAINTENNSWFWDIYGIYQKDPLNKFAIPDEVYDKNGNVDYNKLDELYSGGNIVAIGHNVFSGAYIDWLVEGVWNGKADHETFFEFEDSTLLYYYNGNYYTPEFSGGRGGGLFFSPVLTKITPCDDEKYEIEYYITYDSEPDYYCKAVVGMKESADGFRFWSIFSIDYDYTGNKFNY